MIVLRAVVEDAAVAAGNEPLDEGSSPFRRESSSDAAEGQRGVGAGGRALRRKVFHISYKFTGKHDEAEDLTRRSS